MVGRAVSTTLHRLGDLPAARRLLAAELERRGCSVADQLAILIATHEAAKNGLRFSVEQPVYITLHVWPDQVTVCVADSGHGFDLSGWQPGHWPEPHEASGRGLHLMHELMDAVEVIQPRLGCIVRMTRTLTRPAAA
jgi:anti-sigma regulatory factor (Ser/Thr protein kinase)